MERTLMIIKPEAVADGKIGEVLRRVEAAGFRIRALRVCRLSPAQARVFYEEHLGKPFYDSLVDYMSGGQCVAAVLELSGAVPALRRLVGATNPANAEPGTIRAELGRSIQENAVHATDSDAKVGREVGFFFSQAELIAAD
jgi:nucleoside-diphosphate kinase